MGDSLSYFDNLLDTVNKLEISQSSAEISET